MHLNNSQGARTVVKIPRSVSLPALLALGVLGLCAQEQQPFFIYLFGRYSDFVNIELTEGRIRDTISLVEKYRKEDPEVRASVTMLFSGALSQALAERNAKTGIKDLIFDASRRGVVEIGYDGTDEPTYSSRPLPQIANAKTPEERWMARANAADRILNEARDPVSGTVQKGKSGGLKAMQEVFGKALCIRGLTDELGDDAEYLHYVRPLNTHALMWGLPETPITGVHGYKGSVKWIGRMMSPVPNSAPEMHWMNGFLHLSELSDDVVLLPAQKGPEELRKMAEKANRARVHILPVELSDQRIYLSDFYEKGTLYPPLKVAYDHPDHAKLPPEAFADAGAKMDALALQDALMKYFAGGFVPANAGSRFVSSSDLMNMSPSDLGRSLSVAELQKAVAEVVKKWGTDTYLPDYLTVSDNQYLSLSETFQVLCDVLAEQHRTGKLPKEVSIRQAYGLLTMPGLHGPALGTVTESKVAEMAAQLADRFHDATWKPIPRNMPPTWVDIQDLHLTAGQFLRLMAEAVVAPSPETPLNVKMTHVTSAASLEYPKMRLPIDQGGNWTFKPAPLKIASVPLPKK
jgi:hypothetical protein